MTPYRHIPINHLTKEQAKEELTILLAEIVRYQERYKEQINPPIIDNDYEAIKERYQNIEKKFPDLAYESWPFFWPGKEIK
ncbi:MAG: hypothetical protein IPP67_05740 [Rhodospirillaceae bacterium]|nr:hypothetical protein [Rhodospirillaceae bacterium]